MPNPGQANNPGGVNAFSGPLGQTEPAYGEVERSKLLESAAPVGSPNPAAVPKRMQRRAVKGGGAGASPTLHPSAIAAAPAQADAATFWDAVLNDPGASPLAKQYAAQALGVAA